MYSKGLGIRKIAATNVVDYDPLKQFTTPTNPVPVGNTKPLPTTTTPANGGTSSNPIEPKYDYGYDALSDDEIGEEMEAILSKPDSVFTQDRLLALSYPNDGKKRPHGGKPFIPLARTSTTPDNGNPPANGGTDNEGKPKGGSGDGTDPKDKKSKFQFSDILSWALENPGATAGLTTGALLLATDPFGMIWRQPRQGESPINVGSLLGAGLAGGGLYAGLKYAPQLYGAISDLTSSEKDKKETEDAAAKVIAQTQNETGKTPLQHLTELGATKDDKVFVAGVNDLVKDTYPEASGFLDGKLNAFTWMVGRGKVINALVALGMNKQDAAKLADRYYSARNAK